MRGKIVTEKEIAKMILLRQAGHSLPEICKITSRGNATVFRYVKNISVQPEYAAILRAKQGGSAVRARKDWGESKKKAETLLNTISSKDKLLILASLYWGRGNERGA